MRKTSEDSTLDFFCFLSIFQFFPKYEQLNTGCSLSASVYGNNL